jgi:hypothetical protein
MPPTHSTRERGRRALHASHPSAGVLVLWRYLELGVAMSLPSGALEGLGVPAQGARRRRARVHWTPSGGSARGLGRGPRERLAAATPAGPRTSTASRRAARGLALMAVRRSNGGIAERVCGQRTRRAEAPDEHLRQARALAQQRPTAACRPWWRSCARTAKGESRRTPARQPAVFPGAPAAGILAPMPRSPSPPPRLRPARNRRSTLHDSFAGACWAPRLQLMLTNTPGPPYRPDGEPGRS